MMDYAGRVATADTYPQLLRLTATEHAGELALREQDFGLWRVFPLRYFPPRVPDFAPRAGASHANRSDNGQHSTHTPEKILTAARHEGPTIGVVRSPPDAVLSEVIREARKRLRRGLIEWS